MSLGLWSWRHRVPSRGYQHHAKPDLRLSNFRLNKLRAEAAHSQDMACRATVELEPSSAVSEQEAQGAAYTGVVVATIPSQFVPRAGVQHGLPTTHPSSIHSRGNLIDMNRRHNAPGMWLGSSAQNPPRALSGSLGLRAVRARGFRPLGRCRDK